MSAGRPTLYNPEMNQKAQEYIQKCQVEGTMPWIEELALTLGVCDDTLCQWSYEHPEFSATIKKLRTLQKLELKKGGLTKKFAPHMTIFLLKANHGLNDADPLAVDPFVVRIGKDGHRISSDVAIERFERGLREMADRYRKRTD